VGLFGPKLSDVDFFASAAMTYGQACGALSQLEPPMHPSDIDSLFDTLRHACSEGSKTFGNDSHLLDMFDFHFMQGRAPGASQIPKLDADTSQAISEMSQQLLTTFSQPVSRDSAMPLCVQLVYSMVSQLPGRLSPEFVEPCGIVLGLAMKTIQDDTSSSGRKERARRLGFGSSIGANWALMSLKC